MMQLPKDFPAVPAEYKFSSKVLRTLDGKSTLFMSQLTRAPQTNRALFLIHGQGEHSGRYHHFAHYLSKVYDSFGMVDMRGHGRSTGVRGHVAQFDHYVDDVLVAFREFVSGLPKGTPIDLFGHSQGGLIALRLLEIKPQIEIAHAIICAPLLGLRIPVSKMKEWLAHGLNAVWNSLPLSSSIDAGLLSHDPNVAEHYRRDRLVHQSATARYYFGMKAVINDLMKPATQAKFLSSKPTLPILFQVAGEDEIVDSDATEKFYSGLKYGQKKFIHYPGLYHELYNEISKHQVFDDMIDFVTASK